MDDFEFKDGVFFLICRLRRDLFCCFPFSRGTLHSKIPFLL